MADKPGFDLSSMKRLVSQLKRLGNEYQTERTRSVIVGYTAAYAVHVHEMPMVHPGLPRDPRKRPGIKHRKRRRGEKDTREVIPKGKFWDPQGRAQNKFLEQPARTIRAELREIIRRRAIQRRSIPEALLAAALRLQRASQKLVPVNLGNLKASAFTRLEI